MNGTGHLVEDFAVPTHLCGVCLRKLQWRLGFRVKERYRLLAGCFGSTGMGKEQKWASKQAEETRSDLNRGKPASKSSTTVVDLITP